MMGGRSRIGHAHFNIGHTQSVHNAFYVRNHLVSGRARGLHQDAYAAIPHFDVLYESERNNILLQVRIADRPQSVQNILRA
jgi:hypothetical protein